MTSMTTTKVIKKAPTNRASGHRVLNIDGDLVFVTGHAFRKLHQLNKFICGPSLVVPEYTDKLSIKQAIEFANNPSTYSMTHHPLYAICMFAALDKMGATNDLLEEANVKHNEAIRQYNDLDRCFDISESMINRSIMINGNVF